MTKREDFWEAPGIPAMEEIIHPTPEEVRQSLLDQIAALRAERDRLHEAGAEMLRLVEGIRSITGDTALRDLVRAENALRQVLPSREEEDGHGRG